MPLSLKASHAHTMSDTPICWNESNQAGSRVMQDADTGKEVMMAENMQNGMVRLKEGGEGRGLFPVLQPSGNPYAEAHPRGDLWLQSMWKEGTHSMPPTVVITWSDETPRTCTMCHTV